MKAVFMSLILLAAVGCGKNNESGKSSSYGIGAYSPYTGYGTTTPYSINGTNLSALLQANPCKSGFNGMVGYAGTNYTGQRFQFQVPLTQSQTAVSPGDTFVGVTSYGDVAIVVGQPVGQPPLFISYMCPRSYLPQNGTVNGQLTAIQLGANTRCFGKVLLATFIFPTGDKANFRSLDGGNSYGMPFPAPICLY